MTATDHVDALRDQRNRMDKEVWADEVEAQRHEQYFVRLWDQLRSPGDATNVLASIDISIEIGKAGDANKLPHGIQRLEFAAPFTWLAPQDWRDLVEAFTVRGFRLVTSEWHHSDFRQIDERKVSVVNFVLHLARPLKPGSSEPGPQQKIAARGTLEVVWKSPNDGAPIPDVAHVRQLEVLIRSGEAGFRNVLNYDRRRDDFASAHPLIVHDVDHNGFPEIIVSRWNRVYWNDGRGHFREAKFLDNYTPLAESGIVADFNQDGFVDFTAIDKQGRLITFDGANGGRFPDPPRVIADITAANALAMTAGDVDADGDLDLWISQYKPSYLDGQMPTPYYDANDGDPAFLLINDGRGEFVDSTEPYGLTSKRFRRSYSNSFVDYDDDGDLDLLVVSDYAGIDLYENRNGKMRDVTSQQVPVPHLFGMAHTVADFNVDGLTDLYVIGMSSTTARRLDRLGLGREDRPDIHRMRSQMGFGNRMLLWNRDRFIEPNDWTRVARTGWSWGTTSFDFDLDGDRDIYVANGFRSGDSCRDYCTNFWRHDIYTGNSQRDPQVKRLFAEVMQDLDRGEISWNGYEHNALLMNDGGRGDFHDVGFLLGVGFEYDSRTVVGADLDSDGRPDLLVGEYEFVGQGFVTHLHAYQNQLATDNHWIGVHLRGAPDGYHAIGAKVSCKMPNRTLVSRIVTGDSFLSQHPNTVHFGLGRSTEVAEIEIVWSNQEVTTLARPKIDQYHIAHP